MRLLIIAVIWLTPATINLQYPNAQAEMDSHAEEALRQTQELLRDRQQREKAASESQSASAAHTHVNQLSGGNQQTTDQIYDVTADIFADMIRKTNNDPNAINQLLEEARKNPQGFYNKLSDKDKARIRQISSEVEKNTTAKPPALK